MGTSPFRERLLTTVTVIATLCALTVAVVRGSTFVSGKMAAAAKPPRTVKEWRSMAAVGLRDGPSSPRVTIIEFSDFVCPVCKKASTYLDSMLVAHPNDVALVYRHFPIHKYSRDAAVAAECSHRAGRFRAMRAALFADRASFGVKPWHDFARVAGIADSAAFSTCVALPEPRAAVVRDSLVAASLHLTGTPTFLINDVLVVGFQGDSVMNKYIEDALRGRTPRYSSPCAGMRCRWSACRVHGVHRTAPQHAWPTASRRARMNHALRVLVVGMATMGATGMQLGAQTDRALVRVTVQDSVAGRPSTGALVELRGTTIQQSARIDERGNLVFSGLPPGTYSLASLRVGFRPQSITLALGARDTSITILLVALPRAITGVKVRPATGEVHGLLGSLPGLAPVVGASVQLAGANRDTLTDSVGAFSFRDIKPGSYVVRITAAGFADRTALVTVARGSTIESSHLLDAQATPRNAALTAAWQDMGTRLVFRGFNSALISGDELREHAGVLSFALQHAAGVVAKGLQVGNEVCVFLNGRPMPHWSVNAIRPEEVVLAEVYGAGGDATSQLARQWPAGVPCAAVSTLGTARRASPRAAIRFLVLWTKE